MDIKNTSIGMSRRGGIITLHSKTNDPNTILVGTIDL
jgi:hypothetical protein